MKDIGKLSDEMLSWLLLQALCMSFDAAGLSAGRSFDSELLEAAMQLIPTPKGIPEPPTSPQLLIEESKRRRLPTAR